MSKKSDPVLDKIVIEVHEHNVKLAELGNDVGWLRSEFKKLDYRLWGILTGVILSILIVLLKG